MIPEAAMSGDAPRHASLGDAARLIAALDALLDLGHGELVLHASSLPCATATLCAWASTHELKLSQLASGAVEVCHRDGAHVLAMLYEERVA